MTIPTKNNFDMTLHTLENSKIEDIVEVLNASFSDYIVPMQVNLHQLIEKIHTENIQLNLSIGVFSKGKLVGFMLHALNELDGKLHAYNAATGVIPTFRGQGLVAKMYDFLLPKLNELAAKEMVLEVIVGNDPAIRAYEKMGYTIQRTLNCFGGFVDATSSTDNLEIKEANEFNWTVYTPFWSVEPSWQYTKKSVENSHGRCRILEAYRDNQLLGYLIYNPTNRRVLQICVDATHRRKGIATKLINAMCTAIDSNELFIFNIDDNAKECTSFFTQLGMSKRVSQFEMKRKV